MQMPRQSTTPVEFPRTTRKDNAVGRTSARAGKVYPIDQIPVFRGDSVSGQFRIKADLAEMPKPLDNAVQMNVQAWFVANSAMPQFSGYDEFMHAWQGEQIKALGQADRDAPPLHHTRNVGGAWQNWFKHLGIHVPIGRKVNTVLADAFNLIWNFRAAAHSSRIARRPYVIEDTSEALQLPKAFWPTGRMTGIVPDYERALILGELDLDVQAGTIPVTGLGSQTAHSAISGPLEVQDATGITLDYDYYKQDVGSGGKGPALLTDSNGVPQLFAEMGDQNVVSTLAAIDKSRALQGFAKLRSTLQGNDATGFDNDDAIVAELMQGLSVPSDMYKRPVLLDTQRVTFGMTERHASDAANLDASVTVGTAIASLSLNLPRQESGGVIIVTLEVLPEQLHERQGDPWLEYTQAQDYPDALRDVLRPEPVDLVQNWRIDAAHTNPDALYGYEPMNAKHQREFTRLGGKFYQPDPLNPFDETRAAIWLPNLVDPVFSEDHFLAPDPFPHDVFSDTLGDAVEITFQHMCSIRGLTQFGDVLAENNDDYAAIAEQVAEE